MLSTVRTMAPRTYTLNLMGDTMLGRLIDQMFAEHVHEPEEARIANSFQSSHPHLQDYGPKTPWGDTLPLLHSADLNLLNLETSATTHPTKWPDKVFNYRMHPANISALQEARIDYVSLANNHTLDFSEPGLVETVQTVKKAGIAFAGAGETRDEATRPAILRLGEHEVHVWSASDHPREWGGVEGFHFIDYTPSTRARLKELLTTPTGAKQPALKVFSVHWGPNYAWTPAKEIRDLAHFLIDECGIDIIHGHSSHHVQGVEKYKGSLIVYGCGDFVDDYALVPNYRNDLSGVWKVYVSEKEDGSLRLESLEVFPTKIEKFVVRRLRAEEEDAGWMRERIGGLSAELGTRVSVDERRNGGVVLDLR